MKRPLPTGAAKAGAVRSMFDAIAPRYDLVNRIMTFGLDTGWRRRAVHSLGLHPPATVFDLACGTGDFCRELNRAGFEAAGFDVSFGMLRAARTGAPLVQADALRLPVRPGAADGITCGFALRNVVDVSALFAEMGRVLRPGGRISILEVARPRSPVLRAGHHIYFSRIVPVIGGLLSDRQAYRYLPESAAYLPSQDELMAILRNAGFPDARYELVGLGAAQIITGTRR